MFAPYRSIVAKRRQFRGSRVWLFCLRHPVWLFVLSYFALAISGVVATIHPTSGASAFCAMMSLWVAYGSMVFALTRVIVTGRF